MKVLVDVRLLGRGGTSGIEEYTTQLLARLMVGETSNTYTLFYAGVRTAPLPDVLRTARVNVFAPAFPNKLLDASFRLFNAPRIERFVPADLVWSPHFNNLATGLPRIITFHDLSFLHHPDFFSLRQRMWHWLQQYRAQARRAARIVAVSEYTKYDLVHTLGLPAEKIVVIYSGISDEFRKLPPEDAGLRAFRARRGLHRPYLLSLGTLEPRKNIQAVIRAFNLLKAQDSYRDFELAIVGPRGWLYDEIVRETARSPYKKAIRFFGQVPKEERVYFYNGAAVFLYLSFFEGFGFPPLEAQACGIPVIAANRTSLPEILGDSALLVDPWRVEEAYAALRELLENRARRDALTVAGEKNVARFSWEASADSLRTLIHSFA